MFLIYQTFNNSVLQRGSDLGLVVSGFGLSAFLFSFIAQPRFLDKNIVSAIDSGTGESVPEDGALLKQFYGRKLLTSVGFWILFCNFSLVSEVGLMSGYVFLVGYSLACYPTSPKPVGTFLDPSAHIRTCLSNHTGLCSRKRGFGIMEIKLGLGYGVLFSLSTTIATEWFGQENDGRQQAGTPEKTRTQEACQENAIIHVGILACIRTLWTMAAERLVDGHQSCQSHASTSVSPIQRSHTSWVWTRWKRLFNGFQEKPGYAEIPASVSLNGWKAAFGVRARESRGGVFSPGEPRRVREYENTTFPVILYDWVRGRHEQRQILESRDQRDGDHCLLVQSPDNARVKAGNE
ncbi:hypothetical protein BDP27DRAFT_1368721 [Rhodocollybia butyracea]|uniref:Uncharacterized protein n=1 Tax=Rhodocollybia butyracea TaxID=206335 RepID=A0A9P5PBN0_9AGAR|nr:hypothetical protein BDP27DRAFT_1368721 [Rhodocollybia butyracea]